MKTSIIESKIRSMVEEEVLRSRIRPIVSEAVYSRIGQMLMESSADDEWSKMSESERINAVTTMMDDPKINKAQIWYKVLPGMDPDSARGFGDKILNGERDWPPGALRKAFKILRNY